MAWSPVLRFATFAQVEAGDSRTRQRSRFRRDADLGVLIDAGRTGAELAHEKPATTDGGESPSQTWKTVLWSMYLKLFNPPSLTEVREDRLAAAVLDGIGVAAATFGLEERDPPEPSEGAPRRRRGSSP